jgi:hypothetical protein
MWSDCVKRRALKLLLFLLAGAIINVAIAWGSARDILNCGWRAESSPISSAEKRELASKYELAPYFSVQRVSRVGTRVDDCLARINSPELLVYVAYSVSGWPFHCFRGDVNRVGGQAPKANGVWLYDNGFASLNSLPNVRLTLAAQYNVVPFVPIWPGFAINTIFYAAVLWVLCAVPGKVRCWRRIKRGQCASCGYSLRGTPQIEKCSECGATA